MSTDPVGLAIVNAIVSLLLPSSLTHGEEIAVTVQIFKLKCYKKNFYIPDIKDAKLLPCNSVATRFLIIKVIVALLVTSRSELVRQAL